MSSMMHNVDMIPSIRQNKQPIENRRCVAWDDDTIYLVSGIYRGRLAGRHLVETDFDSHDRFQFDNAICLMENDYESR